MKNEVINYLCMEKKEIPEVQGGTVGTEGQTNPPKKSSKILKPILWIVALIAVILIGKAVVDSIIENRKEKEAQLVIDKLFDKSPRLRVAEADVHFWREWDANDYSVGFASKLRSKLKHLLGDRKIAFPVYTRFDSEVDVSGIFPSYYDGILEILVPIPNITVGATEIEWEERVLSLGRLRDNFDADEMDEISSRLSEKNNEILDNGLWNEIFDQSIKECRSILSELFTGAGIYNPRIVFYYIDANGEPRIV